MDPNQVKGKSVDDRLSAYHNPEKVVEEKQPEPMPSSNQNPTEEVKPEPKTEVAEIVSPKAEVTEEEALANSKNPERTKAYIDKLKEERDRAIKSNQATPIEKEEYGNSVFDSFHPEVASPPQQVPQPSVQTPYLNPVQVEQIKNQFIAPDGTVDINGLNNALYQADLGAKAAQQRVIQLEQKIQRVEENRQVEDAHKEHPEINPLNKGKGFDPNLYNLVRDRILRNMWEGKNNIPLSAVTAQVKREINYTPKVDTTRIADNAVNQYKQTQKARNQGPFESGRGEEVPTESIQDLRKETRRGGLRGDRALTMRLKRIGL